MANKLFLRMLKELQWILFPRLSTNIPAARLMCSSVLEQTSGETVLRQCYLRCSCGILARRKDKPPEPFFSPFTENFTKRSNL